ncbi:integrase [Marinobacterium iners]|uniref:tyrosine-type recombinase/integrase n=1 Tax=Marinobacterium iners TaxID=48076 RepID=UPI001A8DFBDB|nr:site-specific integrase [Marinobacterium iners]QSR35219.1 integrase [Marinobacterium iners]
MPRKVEELSDVQVRRLKHGFVKGSVDTGDGSGRSRKRNIGEPRVAYHAVGGVSGLYLQCRPPQPGNTVGARSWILRTTVGSKRRDIGLGGYPDVTLSMAREKARALKEQILKGGDPVAARQANRAKLVEEQAKAVTFAELARVYILKKVEGYKESSRAGQKRRLEYQLSTYAFPFIGKKPVGSITTGEVVAMLEPIWLSKHETASRVRIHVKRIFDLAIAEELMTGDNPADPARLDNSRLTEKKAVRKVQKVQHLKALPVADMPTFWGKLQDAEGLGAKALQLLILTAARSGEVRGARWDEIDLEGAVWRIPEGRMKTGLAHSIPLPDQAVELLRSIPRTDEHVFPSTGKHGILSDVMVSKVPKKLGYDVTAHGFRSTFKDWSRSPGTYNHRPYDDDHTEIALAHVNSTGTRAAYARGEVLEERRPIMQDWADYVAKEVQG